MQSATVVEYPISTYLPRDVIYFDGTSAVLPKEYVLKEGNLRLFVPRNKIEEVVNALRNSGFKDVNLKSNKGEKFYLSMKIYNVWELHVRIYDDGFIDGHFELSRDYLEYQQYQTIPSIYEVFDFYRIAYDKLHIYDAIAKKWIKEVRTQYLVTLNPPKSLTQWEPIAVIGGVLSAIGIIAYALSRLDKGEYINGDN
ncbi:hypothetical protein [Acidianus ambivalens]|uniref:Uncharacterized protein n=1 Tax=Acidianus ambivalens TaxID=2283 RepID=A0A650CUE2_ACIAM|nr:hypothetical protein [Acidianus ambivalens]MQL56132.1 hypothetical protein [Acidianus ambivalens]QGR21325.1 hypothetical protein D1866_04450 [Acidianus ambivalens]